MSFFILSTTCCFRWNTSIRWGAAIATITGLSLSGPLNGMEPPSSVHEPASNRVAEIIRVEPPRVESSDLEPSDAELENVLVPVSQEALVSMFGSQVGWDDQLWAADGDGDRNRLMTAIDQSLAYLSTPAAADSYAEYPIAAFTLSRVQRSLERFRTLVLTASSATELQQSVLEEFVFYRSVGHDGEGTVDFTGYFEPTYAASRVPTSDYRYPLYRLPSDFESWTEPHPTRAELEGCDGLQGAQGWLSGNELVWLGDRLEAFLIQVQGSARLQLIDGTEMSVGYAGRTNYPYQSIGRLLIDDGEVPEYGLSLPAVLEFFDQNPSALDRYLPQNNRFVFFRETFGAPPQGTLSVPVTAERSIATDKSIMPPGALALIVTDIPIAAPSQLSALTVEDASSASLPQSPNDITSGPFINQRVNRYVLDQDTGGAIRGPGRVDVFMGTGQEAGERAGLINTSGALYYLLLRD
ncbi:MAG: MltA domain-containing protein [Cyanobacteria bacterium J06627_8]